MANTHVFETRMSKRMQASFINKPVYRSFVNTEERANLSEGTAVTRPFRGIMRGQDVTRSSEVSFQDIEEENETLTVNSIKSVPFMISNFDQIQSNFNLIREWSEDASAEMKSIVDGNVLAEIANAVQAVDDSDFGGTAGDPVTLDESNVFSLFNLANRKLREVNVDVTGLDPRMDMKARGIPGVGGKAGFGVLSPYFFEVLERAEQGRETAEGDRIGKNGFVKSRGSLDLMISNNLYWSAVLELATNPTNTDTLTIGGVIFTFVSSIGSTAGNVLIGGDVDATRVNLAALINTPGTTTANGVTLSNTRSSKYIRSDREKMEDLTATDSASDDTLTLTATGKSYYVLASSLTDGTDNWTKETQHNVIGKKGCIDMVSQAGPSVQVSDAENYVTMKKIKPYIIFGLKSFLEGTYRMINVKINTAALTYVRN